MSAGRDIVPDLLLEQYALGELSDVERAEIEEALDSDSSLRARLEALEASNEEILSKARPAQIAAAIRRRMLSSEGLARAGGGPGRRASSRPALYLSAAALLIVLAGVALTRTLLFPSVDDLSRPKGGAPGFSVYRKSSAAPEELRDGTTAAAGDLLQIKYSAGGARYGAIFSLDGRGRLTRHFPAPGAGPGSAAPRLSPGGAALDAAYELDDAPEFERFFLITSKSEFDLSSAASALRDLAASGSAAATVSPRLPAGMEWKSLLLVKKAAAR